MLGQEQVQKYAVIACPHCGFLQGRKIVGSVFGYKGPFKSVNCFRCNNRIDISKAKILFRSDSREMTSSWIIEYESKLAGLKNG
jgi:hypothetical protein